MLAECYYWTETGQSPRCPQLLGIHTSTPPPEDHKENQY